MTGQELTLGSMGISVILSILLRMLYATVRMPSALKPWVSVGLGLGLAVVVMYTTPGPYDLKTITTYLVSGFMTGATAVGLYEITKRT